MRRLFGRKKPFLHVGHLLQRRAGGRLRQLARHFNSFSPQWIRRCQPALVLLNYFEPTFERFYSIAECNNLSQE